MLTDARAAVNVQANNSAGLPGTPAGSIRATSPLSVFVNLCGEVIRRRWKSAAWRGENETYLLRVCDLTFSSDRG